MAALCDENFSHHCDDDQELENRLYRVDIAASDLDLPGSELDDENEEIREEDEENNFYSRGDDQRLLSNPDIYVGGINQQHL